ncbi:hypothetical protein BsIDN1_72250 [Bacillus safensis]|uniref:Uncharacterized protein n=1 Tax=Bacillus safensis TaxID=561879 RepID=A0A5S9MJJ9_BACIA|nr:hypothetical protein BsIDN1_72250 [Bacillus safensis]
MVITIRAHTLLKTINIVKKTSFRQITQAVDKQFNRLCNNFFTGYPQIVDNIKWPDK